MPLRPATTPLYNHPLPEIEQWLIDQGCQQSSEDIHCWYVERPGWQAEVCLDIEQLNVRYQLAGEKEWVAQRAFKYSLSREDVENAIFAGP